MWNTETQTRHSSPGVCTKSLKHGTWVPATTHLFVPHSQREVRNYLPHDTSASVRVLSKHDLHIRMP